MAELKPHNLENGPKNWELSLTGQYPFQLGDVKFENIQIQRPHTLNAQLLMKIWTTAVIQMHEVYGPQDFLELWQLCNMSHRGSDNQTSDELSFGQDLSAK